MVELKSPRPEVAFAGVLIRVGVVKDRIDRPMGRRDPRIGRARVVGIDRMQGVRTVTGRAPEDIVEEGFGPLLGDDAGNGDEKVDRHAV